MKKFIFFVICFFSLINSSWAITLTCPEVASPGEEIKLHIEEDKVNGIKAKYKFVDGFLYQDINLNSSWKSYYDGLDGFSIGNVKNKDKLSMDIVLKVDMDVSIDKDYTLELVEIEGNDEENKTIQLDDLSCKVKMVSNVNTLDSLIIEGVNLSPKFDKNVYSYKATTKNKTIVIRAKASDSKAKVSGDLGEKTLNLGVNTFVIKVTSVRGNTREYKIYITREVEKTYSKSSDATLKELSISGGNINFKRDKFLYNVDVLYEVDEVSVRATPNNSKASVNIIKSDKLVVGENTINVNVVAEDGTKATYVIVVNRKDKLSSDASLKNIIIKNYDIRFKSDVYEYGLDIDGEEKLDIEVVLNDEKAKYKISGNKDLRNNSVIEIKVTAEDGSSLVYKIKIGKVGESNSNSIFNFIGVVPLVLFIVLIFSVLIVKILKDKVSKDNNK